MLGAMHSHAFIPLNGVIGDIFGMVQDYNPFVRGQDEL
jgi:hypothetical protein